MTQTHTGECRSDRLALAQSTAPERTTLTASGNNTLQGGRRDDVSKYLVIVEAVTSPAVTLSHSEDHSMFMRLRKSWAFYMTAVF